MWIGKVKYNISNIIIHEMTRYVYRSNYRKNTAKNTHLSFTNYSKL